MIATALAVVAAEIGARLLGWAPVTFSRPYDPFLVSGDFSPASTRSVLANGPMGPGAYGYRDAGASFRYERSNAAYATDRSDFLFQHYLSRYTPRDVDRLTCNGSSSKRIFVVGGSLAVGSSATTKERSWHALLEAELRGRLGTQALYVFNAAMGAFVSAQERLAFEFAVVPRAPDLVLILDGYNDLLLPAMFGVRAGDPFQVGLRYEQIYGNPLWWWAREHSAILAEISARRFEGELATQRRTLASDPRAQAQYQENVSRVYQEHIEAMLAHCQALGIPCIVALQPFRAYTDVGEFDGDVLPNGLLRAMYRHLIDQVQHGRFGMDVVDLSGLFKPGTPVYTDTVHLNDEGQRAVAMALVKNVERALAPHAKCCTKSMIARCTEHQ